MSRAYTKEEVLEKFFKHVNSNIKYWSEEHQDMSIKERIRGAIFSTLVIFDGGKFDLPAINLVLNPHPDDKQYNIDNSKNYFEEGMVINDDCQLHDML